MFHVRQGRRKFVPGVHRADARWRAAPEGPRRAGAEAVLLPSDDPLPRRTHRRSLAVRLKDLAPRRRTRGEGFLGLQSFESSRRVRGVAWFERGDRLVFPLTRNPTSLGCWRLRFKSGRTHLTSGSKPMTISRRLRIDGSSPCAKGTRSQVRAPAGEPNNRPVGPESGTRLRNHRGRVPPTPRECLRVAEDRAGGLVVKVG